MLKKLSHDFCIYLNSKSAGSLMEDVKIFFWFNVGCALMGLFTNDIFHSYGLSRTVGFIIGYLSLPAALATLFFALNILDITINFIRNRTYKLILKFQRRCASRHGVKCYDDTIWNGEQPDTYQKYLKENKSFRWYDGCIH